MRSNTYRRFSALCLPRRSVQLALVMTAWAACLQLAGAQTATGPRTVEPPGVVRSQAEAVKGKVRRVTGYVLDDKTGTPLSGAKVSLIIMDELILVNCAGCPKGTATEHPRPPRVTVTGSNGRFIFDGVPDEALDIQVSKAGYLGIARPRIGTEPQNFVSAKSRRKVVLRLAPAASISIVARDHTGAKLGEDGDIALCGVTYWAGWPHTQYIRSAEPEANGTYRFEGLQEGRYFLVVSPDRNRPEPGHVVGDRAMGEVPVHYPAPAPQNPSPALTLHEGEQMKIDVQIPEVTLHHVAISASPAYVSSIWSASAGVYSLHEIDREKGTYEAWLPDGLYWPTNRRSGEIDGPLPIKVAGADVSGLHFESAKRGTWLPATIEASIEGSPNLMCGPFGADSCELATVYMLYEDPEDSTGVGSGIRLTASMKPIATTLLTGRYSAVVRTHGNLYVKSIRCGAVDLSREPLLIHSGQPPAPIQVELAQAGEVDGMVERDGKPAAAYVYALPEEELTNKDFRPFEPVESKNDGTFRIEGLAPGTWTIFATDRGLDLNVHDPADTSFWSDHGSIAHVVAADKAHVVVKVVSVP